MDCMDSHPSAPTIIGISAYFHDAASCLLQGGRLVAAAEEERFSRKKFDASLPCAATRNCLRQAGLTMADVDCVAYYENPTKKLGRQIWMSLPGLPPVEAARRLDPERPAREIRELLGFDGRVEFVEHHQAHAASSYFFSGFPDAAVLTVDGVGEWATTSYGRARGMDIELFEEVQFPDSLGLLYATLTSYLGFSVNEGEYKVMGLAPYGRPRLRDRVRALVRSEGGGQFQLDMRYFDFLRGHRMYSDAMIDLLGAPPRVPEAEFDSFHHDLASSLQAVLEDILLEKVRYLYQRAPSENLCLAGGVALNCVANARIEREGPFRRMFVQPAANDAGSALGAAALAHVRLGGGRPPDRLEHVYLGPAASAAELDLLLSAMPIRPADYRDDEAGLLAAVVDRLDAGQVIGWFQGRMEFGPRALGARSILADPRDEGMRDRINALVKKREAFRPFAPAVLVEKASEHFELDHPSPFMLETCQVRSRLRLPAITHVDGSARVQTVEAHTAPRFAALLREFERRTGCPILLNTSFNLRDEPIVCSPIDALLCFVRSGLDALVLEHFLIDRRQLPEAWPAIAYAAGVPRPALHTVYSFL
jgi:carbamoyltransferase